MERRPTLLHSCASAATAAEARFRVDYPNSTVRASRVIALDRGAAAVVGRLADREWSGSHFLTYLGQGTAGDAVLRAHDGSETRLSQELTGADVSVMVATSDAGAEAASVIGNACFERGIMTAGLIVAEGESVDAAVSSLRPYASVLVVAVDDDYVAEMLYALRA